MKNLLALLLLAATAAGAQTTDILFRVDSMGTTRYYFVTSTVYTDTVTSDKQVQEFQRFFDNKDSVAAYAERVRAAIRQDSALARTTAVIADSSAARVDRLIDRYQLTGGFRSMRMPPPEEPAAAPIVDPQKATPQKTVNKKRVKNLKSKQ